MTTDFDIFIIGGGINGCGIARDAAGRGYRVALSEMNDLASGTSSWSTKIVHGGLRYLEHLEFRLVREALIEREKLWYLAPHIIHPMRFVLPQSFNIRPYWLVRLGLFIYDYIGGRKLLPPTQNVDLSLHSAGESINFDDGRALVFSDCRVDDSRLTILSAVSAAQKGAQIYTRTKVIGAIREHGYWRITVENTYTKETHEITAQVLINAAGPWADIVSNDVLRQAESPRLRLVQGSHIIVRKKFDHEYAYFFQNLDGRVVFAIPYHGDFTLIGTTDRDFDGDPAHAEITAEEMQYLCESASRYFKVPITPDDIISHYAGVRALYDDGSKAAQKATRDYVIDVSGGRDEAKLITVYGGKITTYRRLAETVMRKVSRVGPTKSGGFQNLINDQSWTSDETLPGGDFPVGEVDALVNEIYAAHKFLPRGLAVRYAYTYGTRSYDLLKGCSAIEDLGANFGHGLYAREVEYLIVYEFAHSSEDILWRRTKLGLYFDQAGIKNLDEWLKNYWRAQK